MLRKVNESKVTICCCMGAVFLVMLLLNILTVMVMDDYLYAFSFETGERITNIIQIFPSMYRHYFSMNGRLIVHFLVQAFELVPAIVFDVLNTLMFCILLALMYYYSYYRIIKKHNALILAGIAAMLWKFTPAFGHAFLWQDGSVNYLWPAVFVLLYLFPLVAVYDNNDTLTSPWKKVLWVIGGLPVGALSESFSMAALAAVFLIIVLNRFYKKEKIRIWTVMGLIFCMLGYLVMNLSPGTWNSKLEGGKGLASSFLDVLNKYTSKLMWLLVLWIVMLVVSFYLKWNRQAIIFSCLFMAVSFSVNFLHIIANAYPLRSMTAVVVFLIMADICLLSQLWGGRYEVFACIVCVLSIYFAAVEFFPGSYDILTIYRGCRARESYIIEERDKGNLDLQVSIMSGDTKYSSLYTWWSLKKSPTDWRNIYMAKYYEVNTISGVKE